MTSATVSGTASIYTYDPVGNRATEKVGTQAQSSFTWDPNASVPLLASTTKSATTTDYYYGAGLEASKIGSATSYYQLDQTGSIADVISGTAIAAAGSYQPFGVPRTGSPGVVGFDAEYRDGSTGFVNLRARMYDPATASFLSADPIGSRPDYTFGGGNPAMFSDPSGLNPVGDALWEMLHNPVASWQASSHEDRMLGLFAGAVVATSLFACVVACAAIGAGLAAAASSAPLVAYGAGIGGAAHLAWAATPYGSFSWKGLAVSTLAGAASGLVATGFVALMSAQAAAITSATGATVAGPSLAGLVAAGGIAGAASLSVQALMCDGQPSGAEAAITVVGGVAGTSTSGVAGSAVDFTGGVAAQAAGSVC